MSHFDEVVTVLICERRPRLAIGLANLLERSSMVRVIYRTDDARRIVDLAATLGPQVVITNADRPGCNLSELCGSLSREHGIGVVLLSMEGRSGPVREALEAGAHSILSWPFHPRDLVLAVVHAGKANKVSSIEALPEVERQMKADGNLNTGDLNRLMDWASRPAAEELSPRLRAAPGK